MGVTTGKPIIIMTEFTFLYRGGRRMSSTAPTASPEELQKTYQKWAAWFESLKQRGALVNVGHPLESVGSVVTGTSKLVSDGPYAETKDLIGGYSIVTAANLAAAVELAKGCPICEVNGSVEVRPIMPMGM